MSQSEIKRPALDWANVGMGCTFKKSFLWKNLLGGRSIWSLRGDGKPHASEKCEALFPLKHQDTNSLSWVSYNNNKNHNRREFYTPLHLHPKALPSFDKASSPVVWQYTWQSLSTKEEQTCMQTYNSPPGGPGNTFYWTLLKYDIFIRQTLWVLHLPMEILHWILN